MLPSFYVEVHIIHIPTFLISTLPSPLYPEKLKSLLLPVKCLVGEQLVNWRSRHVLSGFWPAPAPLSSPCLFLPTSMEWQLVTVGAPQYGSDPPTIVELRKSIKVFLSLSITLFSLFSKQRINQLYTHTYIHTTHFFSLPSVYSAASDHLDLTCIVKNWAALPLSSSLSFTPFLFQLSVINVQVLQYTNRGEEESEEWGMNWWMGG